MSPNRKLWIVVSYALILSVGAAYAGFDLARLGEVKSIELPSFAVLDEHVEPIISRDATVGFVPSVTAGSILSFNLKSGRIISSVVVGNTVGRVSMVESGKKRLIAVPAANSPDTGHPATISIIDARNPEQLDLHGLLVLPPDAHITPNTRPLLTGDGEFCIVASSFEEPTLFAFKIATGELVSQLPVLGRPSEMALFDHEYTRSIAVISAVADNLAIFSLDRQGHLSSTGNFSPASAGFDQSNNPVFSPDGSRLYIAAAGSGTLFKLESATGALLGSAAVSSPRRITVAGRPDGTEVIGVLRATGLDPGGVVIFTSNRGGLSVRAELAPPPGVDFTRANNVVFHRQAPVAFAGSAGGIIFAFNIDNGELESFQFIGREIRRVALAEKEGALAAIRATAAGDQLVIVNFEITGPGDTSGDTVPVIESLDPAVVPQGRLRDLRLRVRGQNFAEVNTLAAARPNLQEEINLPVKVGNDGTSLIARLPKTLFDQPGEVFVRVATVGGAVSQRRSLPVVRPDAPAIDRIKPDEVPGPADAFTLRVLGKNFRLSSAITVEGLALNTEHRSSTELRARIPADSVKTIGTVSVQVIDLAVPDLTSNEMGLDVFGPRIAEIRTRPATLVAGSGSFSLVINGENFRSGAQVEIAGTVINAQSVRRLTGQIIRVRVPRRFNEEPGTLAIAVRNPDSSLSNPLGLESKPPVISSIGPDHLIAGISSARIDIRGSNFRRRARVFVVGAEGNEKLGRMNVRFRSGTHLVVHLREATAALLSRPGALTLRVVNPNIADGVSSLERTLDVRAPSITSAVVKRKPDNNERVSMVIQGADFRTGAIVEFVSESDGGVRERTPARVHESKIVLGFPERKLAAWGRFVVRVVNPGDVPSNEAAPVID